MLKLAALAGRIRENVFATAEKIIEAPEDVSLKEIRANLALLTFLKLTRDLELLKVQSLLHKVEGALGKKIATPSLFKYT